VLRPISVRRQIRLETNRLQPFLKRKVDNILGSYIMAIAGVNVNSAHNSELKWEDAYLLAAAFGHRRVATSC
jgi:hypothetical protein